MLNCINIIGNLTRDPELKYLPSGASLCMMGLACNDKYKNQQGEMVEDTVFVNVQCWSGTADSCAKNLVKGNQIAVTGKLKLESWENDQGEKRSKMFIRADRIDFLKWGTPRGEAPRPGTIAVMKRM